ncbi:MAG: hypothetical protein IT381_01410 [Deltaproteobacteria bacterium]|nr:hypothetical protein [Deltaproteobacteria bacterium]
MSEGSGGPTEDMVRRLLQLNPQLRGDGQSTRDVVSHMQDQFNAGQQKQAAPAPAKGGLSLAEEIERLKRAYGERTAGLRDEQAHAKTERAGLAAQRKSVAEQACARVIDALLASDPDLTADATLAQLDAHAAFLKRIGFSQQKLLAAEKARKGGKR